LNPLQRSPRWRGPHHERQPAHQLIEYPSTPIADYGREKTFSRKSARFLGYNNSHHQDDYEKEKKEVHSALV